MAWVIDHSPQKGGALVCLLMIANHAHADGTNAFPSYETLARECRMSRRQLVRIVQQLEGSGDLVVEHRVGRQGPNRYAIVMNRDIMTLLEPVADGANGDIITPPIVTFATGNSDIAMSPEPINHPLTIASSPTRAVTKVNGRDQLWDALVTVIGQPPETRSERGAWNKAIMELRGVNATADDIIERSARYRREWPRVKMTAPALARHWSEFGADTAAEYDPPQLTAWND